MDKRKWKIKDKKISKQSQYKFYNQHGITLISLVITIIIMVILASVSLNATIGDNGIISKAKVANMQYSMSALEEFLQSKYIELYTEMDSQDTKLDYLLNNLETRSYIQKSKNGDCFFIDATTGNVYYFIEKSALPDDIKNTLVGGNNSLTGKSIWADFNDIYGITSDLKVYYCGNNYNDRLGANDEKTSINLSNKYVSGMEKGTNWANAMGFEKDVSLADLTTVTELTITDDNLDFSLAYNLGNLKRITFKNLVKDNLNGINLVNSLQYVYFDNCQINDYSALSSCTNLQYLYMCLPKDMTEEIANTQVLNLCDLEKGIGKADLQKLEYFGVFGINETYRDINYANYMGKYSSLSKLTDISPFANISSKKYIKYLYLNGTSIKSFKSLEDFSNLKTIVMHNVNGYENFEGISNKPNLEYIYAQYGTAYSFYGLENNIKLRYLRVNNDSNLTTLKGLINCNNLKVLYAYNCNLGLNEEENKSENDALYALKDISLTNINLENNKLKWVSYLKNCTNLVELYLNGNDDMYGEDLVQISSLIQKCGNNQSIPVKYSLLLLDNNTTKLDLKNEKINIDNFKTLKGKTRLEKLDLQNLKLTKTVAGKETEIDTAEYDSILNEVLSTLTNMKNIRLSNISGLNTITFVKSMQGLKEIILSGTNVSTGTKDDKGNDTGLELLNNIDTMLSLEVDKSDIDLSKITQTLNRFSSGYHNSSNFFNGLYALKCTVKNLQTLNNSTCGLTKLCLTAFPNGEVADLSNCITLKQYSSLYEHHSGNVKLPDSVEEMYLDQSYIYGSFPNNLKSIYFHNTLTNDVLKNLAQSCPNLESLQAGCNNVTDLSCLSTAVFKDSLQTLILSGDSSHQSSPIKLINLNGLEGFSSLNKLQIEYTELNDITGLKNCPNLKELILRISKIKSISSLNDLTSIEKLTLDNNSIASLHGIENLKNMHTLDITKNTVSDITQYEKNGSIKTVTNASIIANLHTNNGGKLERIYLENNPITELNEISKLNWTSKSGF